MDLSQQKEQFSVSYLRAVAAVAGYNLYEPVVDDDSVDWGIATRGTEDTPRRPRVELQLKCTARNFLRQKVIRFPLEIKNYDDLRTEDLLVPRILIVVMVPQAVSEWLRHSEEELALRHCGYWVSLRGEPPVQNRETITVSLPRSQQLTPEAVQQIMKRINDGEAP
jgi:Domain of unknown function (DUF4365)